MLYVAWETDSKCDDNRRKTEEQAEEERKQSRILGGACETNRDPRENNVPFPSKQIRCKTLLLYLVPGKSSINIANIFV